MSASSSISSFRRGCETIGRLVYRRCLTGFYPRDSGAAITSWRSHRAYVLFLLAGVYGTLGLSFVCFVAFPQIFYYRAWEFFDEVVYPGRSLIRCWDGLEKGDLSRNYLWLFASERTTCS